MKMAHFIYDHNGQRVASGLRQFWIDPATGETLVVTASSREGDTIRSTLRRVSFIPDPEPPVGSPPSGGAITLTYEVPA